MSAARRLSSFGQRVLRVLRWIGLHERGTLVLVALIAGGIWIFAALADEVTEGETEQFDERILLAMRNADNPADPIGPQWFEELAQDITALGAGVLLTLLTFSVVGYLLLRGQPHAAVLVMVAVFGGQILSQVLKWYFDRSRPDLVEQLVHFQFASFPSGHSMGAAATYLTLGALLARVHKQRRIKAYVMLQAILLTLAIGLSRVYLGVHWPTDVLAGWTGGAVWALFCWLIARHLQRRGAVEAESQTATEAD